MRQIHSELVNLHTTLTPMFESQKGLQAAVHWALDGMDKLGKSFGVAFRAITTIYLR